MSETDSTNDDPWDGIWPAGLEELGEPATAEDAAEDHAGRAG